MPQEHDLPYRVEVWDDHNSHVYELVALLGDHAVAFAEAVRRARLLAEGMRLTKLR